MLATLVYNPTLVAVHGTYDEVNRLCSEIADKYRWAFVNVNFRPYYSEGSKSYGFEIVEQLGWRTPRHIVVPCAGGSLITKIWKAIKELKALGLIDGPVQTKMHAAQAAGLRADRDHDQDGQRRAQAGAAQHDRQVPRHRQPCRRLLRLDRSPRTRAASASTPPTRRSSRACCCSRAPRASSPRRRGA